MLKSGFYKEELFQMREKYNKNRLADIKLKSPEWLDSKDALSEIYAKKSILLQRGEIVYANIVQANNILFEKTPKYDCPALIVYSKDPYFTENPQVLYTVSRRIYSLKDKDLDTIPKEWRRIAMSITSEHDSSSFIFSMDFDGRSFEFHMVPIMVHRKLLPKGKLCGMLLPVLTVEDCKTVLILPKKYWSKNFTKAWTEGHI
ncbi:MAG: hypothetical protein J6L81_08495 [Clostridia bacterium]|nr:hypothetical protein [Clostridia bacterium]